MKLTDEQKLKNMNLTDEQKLILDIAVRLGEIRGRLDCIEEKCNNMIKDYEEYKKQKDK